jgi:hypothetical protein
MENPNILFEDQNTPDEVRKTLIGFLGQSYKEVSNYDSHLISTNQSLTPKKEEFQRLAERVMGEAVGTATPVPAPQMQHRQMIRPNNVVMPHQQSNAPFVDLGECLPPVNDPNQMEFSFDNSITAKTINSKLESLEKQIKSLDKKLDKVLESLQTNEVNDSK